MFENLEIWWVTGAQLLYGGDAVIAVDAHSKEMVDGLNKSGNLPIKVDFPSSTLPHVRNFNNSFIRNIPPSFSFPCWQSLRPYL